MTRRAVVLFNLGGPDRSDAVEPFLFNLFNDPAVIRSADPVAASRCQADRAGAGKHRARHL